MSEESLDYDFGSVPPAHHALPEAWTFWFIRRPAVRSNDSYSKHLKMLGVVSSVEQFWALYSHTVRPNDLPSPCDLQIFQQGVQPLWEDDANRLGGKLYFRVRKGQSSRMWEDMLLALIGGQFHGCGVCGAVISTRFSEDCISIWNKDSRDEAALQMLRDVVRRSLKLRPGALSMRSGPRQCFFANSVSALITLRTESTGGPMLEYKPHDVSLSKLAGRPVLAAAA
jgi:translation initiation factor 4E